MDGAFPLWSQIAEAKAAGTALWHRDGERLEASRDAHEGFFDAVSRLARLPLIPGPGSVLIEDDGRVLGAAGASGATGDAIAPASTRACAPFSPAERPCLVLLASQVRHQPAARRAAGRRL